MTASIELPGVRPIADELYEQLRDAIVRGELEPNERVVEESIAARANVSRTPVRQALQRLTVNGFVRAGRGGLTVVEFSADELVETCAVRDTLEALAARLAAGGRTELDLVMLEDLTREFEAGIGGDLATIVALNHAFHDVIWDAARNRYLRRQLELVRALIERMDASTLGSEERRREALAEHRAIARALEAGDADAAADATQRHFGRATARRVLAKRGGRGA